MGELAGTLLRSEQRHLDRLAARVVPSHVLALVARAKPVLADRERRLDRAVTRRLEDGHNRLNALAKLLESLGYRQVLERGYALVRTPATGQLVTDAAAARKEAKLTLIFHDGEIAVSTSGSRGKRAPSEEEPVQETLL
jgi:exodeoxyribonuclease VII large subunit